MVVSALCDALLDSLKLLPFLFLTYLFMEWLEHGAQDRFESAVAKAGPLGPVIGSLLGIIPQCGFSGAAATLYAARVVTLGTLVSIFLVTSDEMLPVMISQAAPLSTILKILAIKLVVGLVAGVGLDAVLRARGRVHTGFGSRHVHDGHDGNDIHRLCEQEGCACANGCDCDNCQNRTDCVCDFQHEHDHEHEHCHEHSHAHEHNHEQKTRWGHLALAALRHSLQITLFVFVITLLLNLAAGAGFEKALAGVLSDSPASAIAAAVVGFIPNCAISVALTQLYLDGVLGGAACIAGLLTNAGVGLLVLLRTNADFRENLRIMAFVLVISLVAAAAVSLTGLL